MGTTHVNSDDKPVYDHHLRNWFHNGDCYCLQCVRYRAGEYQPLLEKLADRDRKIAELEAERDKRAQDDFKAMRAQYYAVVEAYNEIKNAPTPAEVAMLAKAEDYKEKNRIRKARQKKQRRERNKEARQYSVSYVEHDPSISA